MNLNNWLKPKENLFMDFRSFVLDYLDSDRTRIFIDRKSDILLVAHVDTVQKPKYIRQRKTKSGLVKRIYAQGLDDRLGCMIAYELSERLDADLLLCDSEEICKSTGQYHDLKDYNWIAEFDRAGGDVVTYDLDCKSFRDAISEYWDIGIGAFSDISQLNSQACCMNVGIGYEFAHSKDSYVCIKTMNRQIDRFVQFYDKYKNTKFVRDFSCLDTVYKKACEVCGGFDIDTVSVFDYTVCRECFWDMVLEYREPGVSHYEAIENQY